MKSKRDSKVTKNKDTLDELYPCGILIFFIGCFGRLACGFMEWNCQTKQ